MRSSILILAFLLVCPDIFAEKFFTYHRFENAKYNALDEYGEEIAKTHGMKLLLVQNVTNSSLSYCIAFTSDALRTFEDGRAYFVPLVQNYLAFLNRSPVIRAYAENQNRGGSSCDPTPKESALKIAFWDKEVNRPKAPYLAEMLFVDGSFFYYVADPETQELQLVHKESYEDAIASFPQATK